MEPMNVFWALTGLGIAASAAYVGITARRERQRMRRELHGTPLLDEHAADGAAVHVTGHVRITGESIEAPLSARRCIAYRASMHLGGFFGLGNKPRETSRMVPFAIARPDGSIIAIDSEHAKLDLPPLALPAGSAERCLQFAISRGIASGDRQGATYTEVVIIEGMRVSVAGTLRCEPLRVAGTAERPIVIGMPIEPKA